MAFVRRPVRLVGGDARPVEEESEHGMLSRGGVIEEALD